MSLEAFYFISQIGAALAVVASLLFVGVQLRQNTRAVRAAASQAHSANYLQAVSSLFENGEVARIWRLGLVEFEALGDDDKVRFLAFTSALFRFYEASRVQRLRGQLDAEHWLTIEQQAKSLSGQEGIRAWWRLRRDWHSADFRQWFESLAAAAPESLYGPGVSDDGDAARH
jgi:hypothetical protein